MSLGIYLWIYEKTKDISLLEIFLRFSQKLKIEIIPFLYQVEYKFTFLLSYIIYMLTCTGISIFRYPLLRDPHDTK